MAIKRIDDATRPDLTTLESGYKLLADSTTGGTKKMDLSVVKNVDNHIDGTTNKVFTATEKTKLSGVAEGANNYTHPSTHSADIIIDGTTNKAYTATEKSKLSGIATGAEVNVNADWNSSSGDSQILNKPTLGSIATKNFWAGTQSAYDLLTPDSNTIYFIIG